MSNKAQSMRADEERVSTPKLRFPEFRGEAGWKHYLLEELEELGWLVLGRGNVISNQDIRDIPGDLPIYSSSVKDSGCMGSYGRFMFNEELISWSIDGGGDFFYRPKHKFSVTNVSGYMRLDTSRLNYRFTASHLQALHVSHTFDYQLKAHPSVIRKLYRLSIPDLAEQERIADCLKSLDEVIAAQGRKVEALKRHKQGLMAQLFPREGEDVPRLRFPKFRKAPAWEERRAGQLFANRTAEGEEGLPIYSVTMASGLVKRSSLERRVDDIAEADGNKKAFKNDIVYNMMRMWQGASGVALEDCMVSPAYVVLAPQAGAYSLFFAILLKLPKYLRLLTSHSQGLTKDRLRLYYKDFAHIPLLSPDVREQEQIANLLSSMDSLIAVQVERLKVLNNHKKGLMQQLFPSLEEMEA